MKHVAPPTVAPTCVRAASGSRPERDGATVAIEKSNSANSAMIRRVKWSLPRSFANHDAKTADIIATKATTRNCCDVCEAKPGR